MGFLRQQYWSELPFPPPVIRVLLELFAMTHPSWVALHGMAHSWGLPGGTVVKNPPANSGDARDMGSVCGPEGSPGVGNGHLFQCSCLENSMNRGA